MSVSQKDFQAKIEHVGQNIRSAYYHLKIHEYMTNELNNRLDSYPAFFRWSRMAHYESGVLRLTRAYDKDSLGLLKIVNIFQSNYRYWDLVRTEISNLNVFKQEMREDISFLEDDKLVQELVHLRNKAIAHTDNKLYPRIAGFSITKIFGEDFYYKEDGLTSRSIEKLPKKERDDVLKQKYWELAQAMSDASNSLLGEKVPDFYKMVNLSQRGLNICNRYMILIKTAPIELESEFTSISQYDDHSFI